MKLPIKLLILCLMGFSFQFGNAQNESKDPEAYAENVNGIFELKAILPNGIGDNFGAKALSPNPGISASYLAKFPNTSFYAGGFYSYFGAKVKESGIPLVGHYDKSRVSNYGIMVAYEFWNQDRWLLKADLMGGRIVYSNKSHNFTFRDTGYNLAISPNISYHIHKNVGISAGVSYQYDFLKIKAPKHVSSFMKHPSYLVYQIGIRFTH